MGTVAERGRLKNVLGYIVSKEGKPVTISELEKAFKDKYTHISIMNTMAHICSDRMQAKYHFPVQRIAHGVWKYAEASKLQEQEQESVHRTENVMYIEILKERDTYILVEDVDDGKIYKMVLIG